MELIKRITFGVAVCLLGAAMLHAQILQPILTGSLPSGSGSATFTHVGSTAHAVSISCNSSPLTLTLGSAPASGSVTFVGVDYSAGTPTVADGNSGTYTKSPSSPVTTETSGHAFLFYRIAGASDSATINVTIPVTSGGCEAFADNFSRSTGTPTFDTDFAGAAAGATGTTTTPTVTSTGTVFYAFGTFSNTASGVTGSWVQNSVGVGTFGNDAAWCLSCSSGTVVQFTMTGTNSYNIIAGAAK